MSTHLLTSPRPAPGVLYGITHHPDGAPIVRTPKVLRVGIGLPRGPAINFWIGTDKKWYCRQGKLEGGKLKFDTSSFASREDCEDYYNAAIERRSVPDCTYPRKIGYFTFTRQRVLADASVLMEPAWDVIEACGPMPTEIDIVLLADTPLDGAYQMWTKSELKCHGDGINAERVLELAGREWLGVKPPVSEPELAAEAKARGERFFPVVGRCWTNGCPYAREWQGQSGKMNPSPCKPNGDLKFQMLNNIRVGGTAYFHTTGIRSIQYLASCLEDIRALTGGRLKGIPLKMVVRPFRSAHGGQAATQFSVNLEFRADNIEGLRRNLIEQAMKFQQVAQLTAAVLPQLPAPPQSQLAAPGQDEDAGGAAEEDDEATQAAILNAEFADGGAGAMEEDAAAGTAETVTAGSPAAERAREATSEKTSALKDRLKGAHKKPDVGEPISTVAKPAATAPAAAADAKPAPAPTNAADDGDIF